MKRNEFIKNLVLTAGSATLLACENDLVKTLVPSGNLEGISVEEAKKWYETKRKGLKISEKNSKKPIWKGGVELKISSHESFVFVPLLYSNLIQIKINDSNSGIKNEDLDFTSNFKTNLVIRKYDNLIEFHEMHIVPDNKYYEKKKIKKIEDYDFDGNVYFFDENNKITDSYIYENGKIKGSLNIGNKNGKLLLSGTQQIAYSYICLDGNCTGGNFNISFVDISYTSGGGGNETSFSIGANLNTIYTLQDLLIDPILNFVFSSLNPLERNYYTDNPWLLPFSYVAKSDAIYKVEEYYCNDLDDNNQNAFKHAFWSAMLSFYFGTKTAKEISDAHENGDPNNTNIKMQMDFFNNKLGRDIYSANRFEMLSKLTTNGDYLDFMAKKVLEKIDAGSGRKIINGSILPSSNFGRCK